MRIVPFDQSWQSAAKAASFEHTWISGLPDHILNSLIRQQGETLEVRHRKTWLPVSTTASSPVPSTKAAVFLGCGDGFEVKRLLATPDSDVTLLEKHPLLAGRLLQDPLVAGAAHEGRFRVVDPFHVFTGEVRLPADISICLHPVLAAVYRDVAAVLHGRTLEMQFDLLMEGELLVDDWYDTLEERHIAGYILPHFWLDQETIARRINHPAVHRVWSINRIENLDKVATAAGKPWYVYEIDPDLSALEETAVPGSTARVFTFRASREYAYRKHGWSATYLPLAAAPRMLHVLPGAAQTRISFAGTSILENAARMISLLQEHLPPEAAREVNQFVEAQNAAPLLPLADSTFGSLQQLGVDPVVSTSSGPLSVRKMLQEWTGAIHRIHLVTSLAPLGIHVWGDRGWEAIASAFPGLVYRGPAGNRFEIPKIYASSLVNVDITRSYQPDVGTIRLFDVFAAGSLCITNVTGPVTELFTSPPLLRFTTGPELCALAEQVLSWSVETRRSYLSEMNSLVRSRHMLANRLDTMLQPAG